MKKEAQTLTRGIDRIPARIERASGRRAALASTRAERRIERLEARASESERLILKGLRGDLRTMTHYIAGLFEAHR